MTHSNPGASALLVCPKCKLTYQAVSGQVRKCKCGAVLVPKVRPTIKVRKKP